MTAHIARLLNLQFETGGRLVVHTHYVPAMAPTHPSTSELQRTVCGQYVFPGELHALEPTCPNCVRLLAEDDDPLRVDHWIDVRTAPGYTLPHGAPDVDAYLSRPLASTPCLDGSTERCVPMATSDGFCCVYCKREIRS